MKRMLFVLLSYLFITNLLSAQERMILRTNGEQIRISNSKDLREAITETKLTNLKGKTAKSVFPQMHYINGVNDTISYRDKGGNFDVNFGFFGQDVMFMWFEAQADMDIKAIGFTCSDDGGQNSSVSMRLIRLNWTKEQLQKYSQPTEIGYYPSIGDGFNESDYFGEEATGDWVSTDSNNPLPPWTDNADPAANTFDYNLWSPIGFTWPIMPVESDVDNPIYNWLEVDFPTSVKLGEMFAVVVEHNGTTLDSDRIGFWSDNTIGYPGWKYYENGRIATSEPGWWVRMYTWDFAVAVEFTSCAPPYIQPTILSTTLSTEPRTVCAEVEMNIVCLGGSDSVKVELVFVVDESDTNIIPMLTSDNLNYCADILGQSPGTNVKYWVQVTDNVGFIYKSREIEYSIFEPKKRNLLVFNGYTTTNAFPQGYYFGGGNYPYGNPTYATLDWDYDVWAYGALSEELVNNYSIIFEITTNGPTVINNDVIAEWLAGCSLRHYIVAGDEWLGGQYGWSETIDIPDGDFAKDIMGINVYYPDINFATAGDEKLPSDVNAVEGSRLGDKLFKLHKQVSADSGWTSSIQYNPTYVVGADNWLDGVEFIADVEVDMTGIGVDGNTYNIAGHRTLAAGNIIAFLAYDPLSLNSDPDGEYWWYGFTHEAPQVQAILWTSSVHGRCVTSVDDELNKMKFSLSQNYPNPFNPSTTIKYQIPKDVRGEKQEVRLTIYDILGRKIATLVNEEQKAGNYEVQFSTYGSAGDGLTSGIYFYKLNVGSQVASRKMLLIK
ncbi:MAG: T9SS type A sorting domain-containing protein [Melioribacteraceae bacterium]|nr:T9SS type A sorting domain-containing protein [Melioribacteraceae bacterium]